MPSPTIVPRCAAILLLSACGGPAAPQPALVRRPAMVGGEHHLLVAPNAAGDAATISTAGPVRTDGLFFQSIGSNGRSCASCHVASEGWTITPAGLRARFDATGGADPVFRANDGSNSPEADVSTPAARRAAYSMLLNKGLIRVGIGIPPGADFELVAVDDPYRHASAAELSLFRRPLPSTNLPFLSGVMWDGRETFAGQTLHFDLDHQASDATTGHAQGPALSAAQQEEIEQFEIGLFTAAASEAPDLAAALLPDLVVIDVLLDGQSGLVVAREMLRRSPSSKVVVLTSHLSEQHVVAALCDGVRGYVGKEQPPSELIRALRFVARGQTYLPPTVSRYVLDQYVRMTRTGLRGPLLALTPRERDVFDLTVRGSPSAAIARQLSISRRTVDTHRTRVMHKLDLHSTADLVRLAARLGVLEDAGAPAAGRPA